MTPTQLPVSRREALAGILLVGATAVVADGAEPPAATAPAPATRPTVNPPWSPDARKAAGDRLLHYFAGTAGQLLRPSQGILTRPSIAPSLPGKRYATQLWDWDTYWTTRGLFRLAALTGDAALQGQVVEHAIGSVLNFLDHQSADGRLPILIDVKNADPLGCLTEVPPGTRNPRNQAKPIFGQMARRVADEAGSVDWLAPHFDKLVRFYDAWVTGNGSTVGLLVWGNDVAIGNDNDPTTFGRPSFSSANLLLNCLFHEDLKAAADLAHRLGRTDDARRFAGQADALAHAIRNLCWDPRDQFFYTVDVQCVDRRAELLPRVRRGMDMSWNCLPLRVQTFTGFLPLWCGVATPEQARALVQTNYLADDRLRGQCGVRSLSSRESMYSLAFSSNPSNWLGPVWIIVNYLAWKGLSDYGFHGLADELRDKTLRLLADDLETAGSLNEYYHPDTGAPLSHPGFMDWNLLVLEMI